MLLTIQSTLNTTEPTNWIINLPNSSQSIQAGLETINAILGIAVSLTVLLPLFWHVWKSFIKPYRTYIKEVDYHYTKPIRKLISKCYIPTRAQDIDPCDQDEIRENNGKYLSQFLIPFFRKKAFAPSSHGKYYLVLADSGMGKSTFLVRLYHDYLLSFSLQKKRPIKLIPLAYKNCLKTIQSVEDKNNTILLLDALDENRYAMKNYKAFFRALLDSTEDFYKVVITCRTQFFPSGSLEPNFTGNISVGAENKAEEIIKKYLSPFSDEEVKLYLRKRYRFKRKIQKQAYAIVQKVPVLMARPIILNWMDFLCDTSQKYDYTFLIYTTILDKWIEREKLSHSGQRLRELSLAVAEYMFMNRTTSMPAAKVEEIAVRKGIEMEPIIAKSRSLLNRNSDGEYKFAHRSFLEYLTVFSILTKKYPPSVMQYALSSSGSKRFLFEILLHSATLSDCWIPDWEKSLSSETKSLLNDKKLLEIFLMDDLDLLVRFTSSGFIVICRTTMRKSDIWKPENVRQISDDAFILQGTKLSNCYDNGIAEFKFEFIVEIENDYCSIALSIQCQNE